MKVGHQTPLRAIRRFCLGCANGPTDVRLCPSMECPLHIYRKGHNPRRRGIGPGRVIRNGLSLMEIVDSAKDSIAVIAGEGVAKDSQVSPALEAV